MAGFGRSNSLSINTGGGLLYVFQISYAPLQVFPCSYSTTSACVPGGYCKRNDHDHGAFYSRNTNGVLAETMHLPQRLLNPRAAAASSVPHQHNQPSQAGFSADRHNLHRLSLHLEASLVT